MSDLAKKHIAENKHTRATFLDLGNCGLTEVPAEVGELVWLEGLSLAGNEGLADLAPLAGLSALQWLDVSSTQVTDLAPLAGLSAVRTLDVSNTQVTDLTPLAGLSALQTLDVGGTQVSDLAPLSGLFALQALYVRGTQVTDLAPLSGLSALRDAKCRGHAGHRPCAAGGPVCPAGA